MAMTEEYKSFLTQRVALAGLGILTVAGLLFGAFTLGGSVKGLRLLFSKTFVRSIDTPVVLVGGSLKLIARDKDLYWMPDIPYQKYHSSPGYAVKSIVVKNASTAGGDGPDKDDSDPTTDKLHIDVSNATSWEVDEFIPGVAGAADVQVASLTLDAAVAYQVDLIAGKGQYLCPSSNSNIKHLTYSANTCPTPGTEPTDPETFSSVKVIVTVGGQKQTWGTVNCVDVNSDAPGHCRIVLRGD